MILLRPFFVATPGSSLTSRTVDKAMIAADPAAAFVGYLSTILATFGLFERIGLNADQVAILGGAVLGLMATLRVFHERTRRQKFGALREAHEELMRSSASISLPPSIPEERPKTL